MTTGTDIMRRAGIVLNDEGYDRWTPKELCEWINDGLKAIVLAKPSAKSRSRVINLQAGTLQSVPAVSGAPTPLALIDVVRNILADGPPRVAGRAVTVVSRAQLDAANPNWHMNAGDTRYRKDVRHVVYDEQNPLEFYVYPGNDGTGKVEAVCSDVPTLLAAEGDELDVESYGADIDLPEVYDPPLIDYVIYRAQSKDQPSAGAGKAEGHRMAFANALGVKIQVEGGSSPNNRRAKA